LRKLYGERVLERVVEYRLTGGVDEVRDQDGITVGQRGGCTEPFERRNCDGEPDRKRPRDRDRRPPPLLCWTRDRQRREW